MEIQHDLHIHTHFSPCGSPAATPEAYIEAANACGVKVFGFCDHVWDTAVSPAPNGFYEGQDIEHIMGLTLPKKSGCRFLRGCEADMNKKGVFGLSAEGAAKFDYVLATHSHSQHEAMIDSATRHDTKKLANALCNRFSQLIESSANQMITAIAHPFFPSGNKDNFDEVLFRISDAKLEDLFADANYHNIALEINASAFKSYPLRSMHRSELFRIYETAVECGCKFVFGTDCHDPAEYAVLHERLRILVSLLDITEKNLVIQN
ncbi:MAG: PHP domain-containing protein [Clostridia bacterium]|nr:PHP domain-containing protein [Clostridia bacterium]